MRNIILITVLGAFLNTQVFAQATATPEQRLREQLKQLVTQLRTAEAERTALQTEKATLEGKVKTLEKQNEEITKQMATDKDVAKAEAEKVRIEITAKDAEIAQTRDLLLKADTFGKQNAELAKKTESERARLASENTQLKRVVADQRVKNARMLEIANEILTRYSKFGLGTAITAREPFVGVTRAKLESLVEDYSGQLAGQRIRIDGTSPAPVASSTSTSSSQPTPPEKKKSENSRKDRKANGAKP